MPTKPRKAAPKAKKTTQPATKPEPAQQQLAPGTVLKKLDRHGKVRCECAVEAGGFKYKGTIFPSLSAAAAAAAKDLGLAGASFNGYVFWGISKPGGDPLARVERLWQRYSQAAVQLAADPTQKAAATERLKQHVAQMKAVAG